MPRTVVFTATSLDGVLVQGSTTDEWVLRQERLLAEPDRWRSFYGERPTVVFSTRELPIPEGADVRLRRPGGRRR